MAQDHISLGHVAFTCQHYLDNFHYCSSSSSECEHDPCPSQQQVGDPGDEAIPASTASASSLFETLGGSPDIAPYSCESHSRPLFLPGQLVKTADWRDWFDGPAEDVRIIDWEQAFPVSQAIPVKKLSQPLDLRCPETFFVGEVDHRVDLWRVGCVIYALFYQHPLFSFTMGPDSLFIQRYLQKLGPLPADWQTKYASMKGTEENKKPGKATDLPLPPRLISKTFEPRRKRIAEAFSNNESGSGTNESRTYDLEALKLLLPIMQGLLQYEPERRMSAKEALKLLDWVDHRREM